MSRKLNPLFKAPIYNSTFKNMIVGYTYHCTNCGKEVDRITTKCPECKKRINNNIIKDLK